MEGRISGSGLGRLRPQLLGPVRLGSSCCGPQRPVCRLGKAASGVHGRRRRISGVEKGVLDGKRSGCGAVEATASVDSPKASPMSDFQLTFDGETDPQATLLLLDCSDCSSMLEPLSGALRDQELVILSATVNPTDGVFRITNQNGDKLDEGKWENCREKIYTYLAATRIFSTQPLVYGNLDPSETRPVQPITQGFQLDNVSTLRKTAKEVMDAAQKLSNIEQEIVELMSGGQAQDSQAVLDKEAKRSEAAAMLDRPLLALEAMLVKRRQPTEVPQSEESRSGGADLRFQAGGATSTGPASGSGFEILLQGFNWDSHHKDWYKILANQASEIAKLGFTSIWLPPPSDSVSPQGYLPRDLYSLDSRYGNEGDLRECIQNFHGSGIKVLADIVINHRCAQYQGDDGKWNKFGGRLPWDSSAICSGNSEFGGRGNPKRGDDYSAAPNIDHSQVRLVHLPLLPKPSLIKKSLERL